MAMFDYDYEGRVMRDNARARADREEIDEALEDHEHRREEEYRAVRDADLARLVAELRLEREREEATLINWLMARTASAQRHRRSEEMIGVVTTTGTSAEVPEGSLMWETTRPAGSNI